MNRKTKKILIAIIAAAAVIAAAVIITVLSMDGRSSNDAVNSTDSDVVTQEMIEEFMRQAQEEQGD